VLPNDDGIYARSVTWLRAHLLPSLAVGVLLLTLVSLLAARLALGSGEPELVGTDLGGKPAPGFTLTDHRGQTVSLSDFRGEAVVLTFIYTNCPDVCPVIARTLQTAHEMLPEDTRDQVALLAVTIDPERDTEEALRAFSAAHNLAGNPNWFALRADRATLEPIWEAYGIHPGPNWSTPEAGGPGHTDAIYLIDAEGRERVFLRVGVAPRVLADNLEALVS
jgi:protein SCO1/2